MTKAQITKLHKEYNELMTASNMFLNGGDFAAAKAICEKYGVNMYRLDDRLDDLEEILNIPSTTCK